jgi:hypothetical protein
MWATSASQMLVHFFFDVNLLILFKISHCKAKLNNSKIVLLELHRCRCCRPLVLYMGAWMMSGMMTR